uniref:CID domain-containing protein n=1 Tax=Parastrongyloides trichosuri TaxID=131310 RepID=A0A0N4ZHA5_PARTI
MEFQEDGVREFSIILDSLKDNNAKTINMLTLFAVELEKEYSSIVKLIENRIYAADTSNKMLLALYVMDSIMKTPRLKYNSYINEFSKNIVAIFVHVFKVASDDVRRSLHKLRRTWDQIINNSYLRKIDLSIHEIDSNWPVIDNVSKPLANANKNGVVPVDPRKKIVDAVKPNIPVNNTQKVQLSPKQKIIQNDKPPVSVNKPPVDPRQRPTDPRQKPLDTKTQKPMDPRKQNHPEPQAPKQSIQQTVQIVVSPQQILQESKPILNQDRKIPQQLIPVRNDIKRQDVTAVPLRRSPQQQHEKPSPIPSSQGMDISRQGEIAGVKRSSPIPVPNENMDDFRKRRCVDVKFSFDNSSIHQPVRVATPPVMVQSPVPNGINQNFPFISNNSPVPRIPINIPTSNNIPASVIKNDTPRIEGIQANNRIFVDGKAYEVLFVDNQPIIERNCLPHKIYFFGNPRKVTIDGKEHILPFRESKTVVIGGLSHVIRFGAPSRELIMNEFAFKGSFGGPPIIANINGRKHEIRLGGPPPEVRIEPEPSFELLPELKKMQKEAKTDPEVKKVEPIVQDIKSLLAKLKDQGIIGASAKPSSGSNAPKDNKSNDTSTNKSKLVNLKEVPKKTSPANISFKDLPDNVLTLDPNLTYQATLEVLYQPRNVCPNCGLQMDKSDDEMFQKHMDWHFRENTRLIQNKNASVRPWNMTADKWLKFSEQLALTNISSNNSDAEGSDGERHTDSIDILSSEVPNKNCHVCGEQFEEYYDEDDDVWKIKSCIVLNNIAYHVSCSNDMALTEQHTSPTTIGKRQVETSVF